MAGDVSPLVRKALIEELEQLRSAVQELAAPLSEQALWSKPVTPGNSIGHLILHQGRTSFSPASTSAWLV